MWVQSWPVLALGGYILVYVSLYLGCRTCMVPDVSAGKLAIASLVSQVILVSVFWWLAWRFAEYTPIAMDLLVGFAVTILVMFLVAPWFLRPADGKGWGSAWGASATGGLVLCILLVLLWKAVISFSR